VNDPCVSKTSLVGECLSCYKRNIAPMTTTAVKNHVFSTFQSSALLRTINFRENRRKCCASLSRTVTIIAMPSQTPTPIDLPVPCGRSLLTNTSLSQYVNLCLSQSLDSKAKSPYTFVSPFEENDYSPPAPPPPSPVNFPSESWSTACRR
jgi:hypothetical protein